MFMGDGSDVFRKKIPNKNEEIKFKLHVTPYSKM